MQRRRKTIVFLTEPMLQEHKRRFPETYDREGVLAIFGIRALAQRINDYASAWLAPIGLNAAKYNHLVSLYFLPGRRTTLNEITKLIHTSNAAVTSMVNALVAEGFVRKLPNPSDRRSFIVELTRKGERAVERAVPLHCGSIERGLRGLTRKDRKDLVRLLFLVNQGFEDAFEPATPSASRRSLSRRGTATAARPRRGSNRPPVA